jgi:hypothetical protein
MDEMTDQESSYQLQRRGFTEAEITRLLHLRREYKACAPLDPARLQFARFLVSTGRLTDQLPEEEAARTSSFLERQPILKMVLERIRQERHQLGLPPSSEFYRQYQ